MSNVDGRVHVFIMLALCLRFRLELVAGVAIFMQASGLDSS